MSIIRAFLTNKSGEALRALSISACLIAFASLSLVQLLDRAGKSGSLPHIAIVMGDAPSRTVALRGEAGKDYDVTPVGAITGRISPPIILDPCTGQTR